MSVMRGTGVDENPCACPVGRGKGLRMEEELKILVVCYLQSDLCVKRPDPRASQQEAVDRLARHAGALEKRGSSGKVGASSAQRIAGAGRLYTWDYGWETRGVGEGGEACDGRGGGFAMGENLLVRLPNVGGKWRRHGMERKRMRRGTVGEQSSRRCLTRPRPHRQDRTGQAGTFRSRPLAQTPAVARWSTRRATSDRRPMHRDCLFSIVIVVTRGR